MPFLPVTLLQLHKAFHYHIGPFHSVMGSFFPREPPPPRSAPALVGCRYLSEK